MADEIRIDDLAAPVLNDVQRMGLEYGETQHTELTVDAVCEAAVARTGLDDFGPDDFRERLDVWLSEMDADPERTGLGRMMMFGDCTRYASNRLRIRDLLQAHPEILDIPIEKPVIVIGLPRSGTTNLVNLLASDSRFRSMPLWESYEPVPDPREQAGPDGVDPRWTRCQEMWEAMQVGAPFVAAMHPMEPDHIHEELELMLPDFSSYNLEWVARCPRWRDHYLAHDQTPHYAYMKTVLQILQWYRPRERWVLKSPQHLENIGPADDHVPRRHRRGDPPRPGGGRAVDHHHAHLRGPHRLPHHPAGVVPRLLDRPHRPPPRRLAARPAPAARGPHLRRVLPRVHGRRDGHDPAHLRRRGHRAHRPRPAPRSRPTRPTTPGGRRGGWSTTCAATSPPRPRRCAARFGAYLDALPERPNRGPVNIQEQVDHLIDTRPGKELLRPVYDDPAHPVVDGLVYRSGGTTAAYMVLTDHGRVIVNTGMGFEAPHHKRVFDAIRPGPTHHIITTQAHVDHVGGVDLFTEPGTTYLAQANNPACQADDRRIQGLRMRTAGIWFDMLGTDARASPSRTRACRCTSRCRRPTSPSRSGSALHVDGLRIELLAAVGETVDCCVVWLPEHRVALVSNLFGPLFPHFPNLNTIRGDKYRFVEPQLATNRMVRELRPGGPRHRPPRPDRRRRPHRGLAGAAPRRRRPTSTTEALEGFNAGTDVWTLMRRDPAAARAAGRAGLRQGLVGGAHLLGGVRRLVQAAVDHRALPRPGAGRPRRAGRRRRHATPPSTGPRPRWPGATPWWRSASGRPSRPRRPTIPRLRALMAGAHRYLLDHGGDVSFWEDGWLRTQLARWESDGS